MSVPSTREPQKIPVSQIARRLGFSDNRETNERIADLEDSKESIESCPTQFSGFVAKRCHHGTPLRYSEEDRRREFPMG